MKERTYSELSDEEDEILRPCPSEIDSLQEIYMMGVTDSQDQHSNQNNAQTPYQNTDFQNLPSIDKSLASRFINPLYVSRVKQNSLLDSEILDNKSTTETKKKPSMRKSISLAKHHQLQESNPLSKIETMAAKKKIKKEITLEKNRQQVSIQQINQSKSKRKAESLNSTSKRNIKRSPKLNSNKKRINKPRIPKQLQMLAHSIYKQDQSYTQDKKVNNVQKNLKKKKKKLNQKGKKRKTRSTITEQTLQKLITYFKCYDSQIPNSGAQIQSLIGICKILPIGYSTVLHKYKEFKRTGTVQEGVLIKFKHFKRNYKKSVIVQNHILNAQKVQNFRTAQQMADFIQQNYNYKVSRSIISRHLLQMKQMNERQNQIK